MKRKRLDRDLKWGFQFYPYYQLRMETEGFKGLVSLLLLTDGDYYYWDLPKSGKTAVCGAHMIWLQLVPDDTNRIITAMYLPKTKSLNGREFSYSVSAWYVDVIDHIEYDYDGVAAFVDKYIDVIFTPQGEIIIDDRDELDNAYNSGELTLEQYKGALQECDLIVEELCKDIGQTEVICSQILENVMTRISDGLLPFKDHSMKKYSVLIAAGGHFNVGLKVNGMVVAAGSNITDQCEVSDWHDIIAIAAGGHHTIGLKADGTIVTTGNNHFRQRNVSDWHDIAIITAGWNHTIGLKKDGTVIATGSNGNKQCDTSGWSSITAISAGKSHTIGLKKDGTVVAVGSNSHGQCDVSDWSSIVDITAGGYHTVGLRDNGTVIAVGCNDDGQCDVSGWSGIVAIAAGANHTIGLKADGSVVAVGNKASGRCNVSGWSDIVAIAGGWSGTIGLKSDGSVVALGSISDGKCNVSGWNLLK